MGLDRPAPNSMCLFAFNRVFIEHHLDTMSPGGKPWSRLYSCPLGTQGPNKVTIIFKWGCPHWVEWDMKENHLTLHGASGEAAKRETELDTTHEDMKEVFIMTSGIRTRERYIQTGKCFWELQLIQFS